MTTPLTDNKPSIAIIVPSIRNACITTFIERWTPEFTTSKYTVRVFVMEDNPNPTFTFSDAPGFPIIHLSWSDIEKTLGDKSWIIPRRSDAIRSFGILSAYNAECEYFITMDDDCYPSYRDGREVGYFLDTHLSHLTAYTDTEKIWINTMAGYKPRGYPYQSVTLEKTYSTVAISHGLWVNVPDFDSVTSLAHTKKDQYFDHARQLLIPEGKLFPLCGMNVAWKRDLTPIMYFLLMGQNDKGVYYDYDRFGDVWCGIFMKKILDDLHMHAVSGQPVIHHERASNPFENLQKEAPGIKMNEQLWKDIYNLDLSGATLKEKYLDLTHKLPSYSPYWEKLAEAMRIWVSLF